jgi:ABC-type multidrug transport system fused ATPase/permease subunit
MTWFWKTKVSTEEKQLLTITRAFLVRPDFFCDRAPSTIRDADLILVMEARQIVEQGT